MPAEAAGGAAVADQDQIGYDRAKQLLLSGLPRREGADLPPEAVARLDDAQVEQLIRIGGYIVDRWAAEAHAEAQLPQGATPSTRQAARRRAIEACTGLHFNTITQRAHDSLRAYQDRHRQVMPATVVRGELARAMREQHAYDDMRRWEWWAVEAFKGFWGFVGLTVIGGALVLLAKLVFPGLPHIVVDGVRQLLEPRAVP